MSCCGRQTSFSTGEHTLSGSGTDQDGDYPSEVEARAAWIRAGKTGDVAPKK